MVDDTSSPSNQAASAQGEKGVWAEFRARLIEVFLPSGIATAVLFLYGWFFTREFFRQMGVDSDSLGYSTTDYVFRSTDALLDPLPVFLFWTATMVALFVFAALVGGASPRFIGLIPLLLAVGVATLLYWQGLVIDSERVLTLLVLMHVTVALCGLSYGAIYRPLDEGKNRAVSNTKKEIRTLSAVVTVLPSLFLMWVIFNATQYYGTEQAVAQAERVANNPNLRSEVVVVASQPLGIDGEGAWLDVAEIGLDNNDASGAVRYRYSGLRLVTQAGGNLLLWPCESLLLTDGVISIPASTESSWVVLQPFRAPVGGETVACSGPFDVLEKLFRENRSDDFVGHLLSLAGHAQTEETRNNVAVGLRIADEHWGISDHDLPLDLRPGSWTTAPLSEFLESDDSYKLVRPLRNVLRLVLEG